MERERSQNPLFLCVLVVVLVSQNLVIPVMCRSFEDQKNYYSPDPHAGSTPAGGSHKSPSHGTSPSPGSSGSYGSTPPSHGSGGSYGTPPHGSGGSYDPTPSTPSTGSGGGYYHSPPSSGGGGHSTPAIITPPSTPLDPNTPIIPGYSPPSTPLLPDPNTPPFFIGTCNYWRTHPQAIWSLFGWWGTVAGAFGVASTPAVGTNLSLQQALANTRNDGFGALYREGTASLLNSMVNKKFPFTTKQVRESFAAALVSNKAAAAQANLFKRANEGRLKPRT